MQGYAQRCYESEESQYCDSGAAGQQQMYRHGGSSYGGGYGGGHGYGQQQQVVHQQSSSFKSEKKVVVNVFGQEPFCEIAPSSFPPGTDRKVIECYNRIDRDQNGVIDDKELQAVLSSCNHVFSLRTIHLLMYSFTHSNKRKIGPKEFLPLLNCLQNWRGIFQRFDRDRNGRIDSAELGQALNNLGYCVSPTIVNLLIAKFNKSGGYGRCSLEYDNFIECCLTVKGLSETFKAKEVCGKATFSYEEFLMNVLPYIIA